MKKILSILIVITLSIYSCEKDDIADNTPECIENKIMDFKINSPCDDAKVKEYLFQGNLVYVFDPGTCGADMAAAVYNKDCESLGSLGGLYGNTIINNEEFSNAEYIRLIWKK